MAQCGFGQEMEQGEMSRSRDFPEEGTPNYNMWGNLLDAPDNDGDGRPGALQDSWDGRPEEDEEDYRGEDPVSSRHLLPKRQRQQHMAADATKSDEEQEPSSRKRNKSPRKPTSKTSWLR